MSKYSVVILPKAIHGLSGIDKHVAKGITDKLTWLSENVWKYKYCDSTGLKKICSNNQEWEEIDLVYKQF